MMSNSHGHTPFLPSRSKKSKKDGSNTASEPYSTFFISVQEVPSTSLELTRTPTLVGFLVDLLCHPFLLLLPPDIHVCFSFGVPLLPSLKASPINFTDNHWLTTPPSRGHVRPCAQAELGSTLQGTASGHKIRTILCIVWISVGFPILRFVMNVPKALLL